MCTSRSKRFADTSYNGPCTDVNVGDVPKLQCYQDTYISICTALQLHCNYTYWLALKNLSLCMTRTSFKSNTNNIIYTQLLDTQILTENILIKWGYRIYSIKLKYQRISILAKDLMHIYEGKVIVILYQLWYQNSIKHINTLSDMNKLKYCLFY